MKRSVLNLAKDFIYVLNFRVLLISIISLVATFFCGYFQIIAEMPLSLIGLAVVFPIVFSINSAFQRRDRALEYYGIINSKNTFTKNRPTLSKDGEVEPVKDWDGVYK